MKLENTPKGKKLGENGPISPTNQDLRIHEVD